MNRVASSRWWFGPGVGWKLVDTFFASQFKADHGVASFLRQHPVTADQGRRVADVLVVAAGKLRYPVAFLVGVETNDGLRNGFIGMIFHDACSLTRRSLCRRPAGVTASGEGFLRRSGSLGSVPLLRKRWVGFRSPREQAFGPHEPSVGHQCVITPQFQRFERIGDRAFELTKEQRSEQSRQNANELEHFMGQLRDALQEQEPDEEA